MLLTANIISSLLPWLEKSSWMLQVIIAFGILVVVHEFGHYISAKLTGMKVEEYSIGFGKRIFGFKRGETEYSWRLVPLGGYCKIFGMEEDLGNTKDGETPKVEMSPEDRARAFNVRPLWERFTVIVAGSFMNVLLAVVIISVMGSAIGFNYSVIGKVEDGSPAQKAGLQPGDMIRNFAYSSSRSDIIDAVEKSDQREVLLLGDMVRGIAHSSNWTEIKASVQQAYQQKGVLLRVHREDGSHIIRVHPERVKNEKGVFHNRIGIEFNAEDNYSRIIDRVMLDTPYSKAGLEPGDEILTVNGESIADHDGLLNALMDTMDDEAKIGVQREGKKFTFVLKNYLIYRSGIVASPVLDEKGSIELNITEVIIDTPAFYMGIRPGMRITQVDGKPVDKDFNWVKYETESKSKEIMVSLYDNRADIGPIEVPVSRVMLYPGITVKVQYIKVPYYESFYESVLQAKVFSVMIFDFLQSIFKKQVGVSDMAGPIGVVTIGYKMASEGIVNLLFFFALISVNLGIINLLPLPGLDGGRAVFLIGELIFRRPVLKAQFENIVHLVGILLLFGFIIFVTFFDVNRIISMLR
jgi:regulator of sigma E protease